MPRREKVHWRRSANDPPEFWIASYERGDVRNHVNVFRNGESIRSLEGVSTPVPDGSSILILAAISGG